MQAMLIDGTGPGRRGCPPDRRRASIVERRRAEIRHHRHGEGVLHAYLGRFAGGS
jgi:hypothetical protein